MSICQSVRPAILDERQGRTSLQVRPSESTARHLTIVGTREAMVSRPWGPFCYGLETCRDCMAPLQDISIEALSRSEYRLPSNKSY